MRGIYSIKRFVVVVILTVLSLFLSFSLFGILIARLNHFAALLNTAAAKVFRQTRKKAERDS